MWKRHWLLWLGLTGALVAVAAIVAILWAAITLPHWLLNTDNLKPADRVAAQNALRSTLVTLLGGIIVAVGAIVGLLNLREATRQNRRIAEQSRAIFDATERQSNATRQHNEAMREQDRALMELQRWARSPIASPRPSSSWAARDWSTARAVRQSTSRLPPSTRSKRPSTWPAPRGDLGRAIDWTAA